MDLEALGHDRSLLTRLVRAEEGSRADAPRPGVLACLGAEEPDMPQGLHQRLRSAIVEPGVGSLGWKLAGDQFQAQQLDVIAAEDRVLSAECLEDAQQAWILEPVLGGDVPGPLPGVGIVGFPDRSLLKRDGVLRVTRAL